MTTPVHADLDLQWGLLNSAQQDLEAQWGVAEPVDSDGEFDLVLDVVAFGGVVPSYVGDAQLPLLQATGELLPGSILEADTLLPAIQGVAYGPGSGDALLPAVEGEAEGLPGALLSGDARLAAIQGSASGEALGVGVGDAPLPALTGTAEGLAGSIGAGDERLPSILNTGVLHVGSLLVGSELLPAIRGDAGGVVTALLSGAATLAPIEGRGAFERVLLELQAWSFSPEVLAHTHYSSGFDFTSLAVLNGKVYGARASGLYLLEGEDDAGEPIVAELRTGLDDFGDETLKASAAAYIAVTSSGALELIVRVDGGKEYVYDLDRPMVVDEHGPSRFPLGRGLRSRFWQVGVRNKDGAYFELDKLGLAIAAPRRRKS